MKHIIIDTDIFGDPDDAIALAYALSSSEIKIHAIITNDEYRGNHRAKLLVRWLASKDINVPVFSGYDLGNKNLFLLERYVPKSGNPPSLFQSPNLQKIITTVAQFRGQYVAIGGLSNLNYLYAKYPDPMKCIQVVIMGGAIQNYKPGFAEHNIRLDIQAASSVFHAKVKTQWILSDLTFQPRFRISFTHPVYEYFANSETFFHQLVRTNMDEFYKNKYPESYLHDPITISSLLLSTVKYEKKKILFSSVGEFIPDQKGKIITISTAIDADLFWSDLNKKLGITSKHIIQ